MCVCVYFARNVNFVETRYFPQIFSVCKTNIQLQDSQVSRFGAKQAIFVLVILSSKQVYLKAISWEIGKDNMAVPLEFEKFNLEKTNRTPHPYRRWRLACGFWQRCAEENWAATSRKKQSLMVWKMDEMWFICARNTTLFLHKNLFHQSLRSD